MSKKNKKSKDDDKVSLEELADLTKEAANICGKRTYATTDALN